jgi:signal transduction histidine kinase
MDQLKDNQVLAGRVDFLRKIPVFAETTDDMLFEIACSLTEIEARPSQTIIKKGDIGNAMYIITSGSMKVHDGNHVLSRLTSGQVFGEYSLFDNEERSASVTAEEPSRLLRLSQSDFFRLMSGNMEVTRGILRNIIQRVREMNELESKLAKSYVKIQKQKAEIEEQNQNITRQKAELEEINQKLTALNEEKNRLIGVISHGLRNPLSSSLCVMDLLESMIETLTDEQKEYCRIVHNSLRKMNSLINQILDIDLIGTPRTKLRPERVNLAHILRQIEENFKYTIGIKRITLKVTAEDLYSLVDRNYCAIIFDNLLSNAIKFSPPEKSIMIRLFDHEDKNRIEIQDEGPGISQEIVKSLFDPPHRQEKAVDKSGLSIAKKYVEAMSGNIACISKPGKGTTFIVTFDAVK